MDKNKNELELKIEVLEGEVTALVQLVESLNVRLSDVEGTTSAVTQSLNSITTEIKDK